MRSETQPSEDEGSTPVVSDSIREQQLFNEFLAESGEEPDDLSESVEALMEMAKEEQGSQLSRLYAAPHADGCEGGPYDWQVRYHEAGKWADERAIIAANRVGKTRTVAAEIAMHMTGQYPPWWDGYRFEHAVEAVAVGTTNLETRDIVQKALCGDMTTIEGIRSCVGNGWIPGDMLDRPAIRQCGVSNVIDTIRVKHYLGDWSVLQFKAYEQGATKFQGTAKDIYWMDEEPEHDDGIFNEIQMRLLDRKGLFFFTRTPLFGNTQIVKYFLDGGAQKFYINVSWDDSPHIDEEQRKLLWDRTPDHLKETRAKGVPLMGTGAVYPVADSQIECDPFEIPRYYRRIVGVDFGIDHPGAACWLAYNPDTDVVYITNCYKEQNWTALQHSARIKAAGDWIPVAWPHDGMVRDKGGGDSMASQFDAHGVNMLGFSARYIDDKGGRQAREPVTVDLYERMKTGRLKVFKTLGQWFEEKRLLHRKDGKIVDSNDDIESAMRYAYMMLRFAQSEAEAFKIKPTTVQDTNYDPLHHFHRGDDRWSSSLIPTRAISSLSSLSREGRRGTTTS